MARNRVLRKTKVIATIGPACDSLETIKAMIRAGMNVARLNFSHGTHEEHRKRLERIREAVQELGANVASMLDTKGVKIRTGRVEGGVVALEKTDFHGNASRVGTLGRWNIVGELGAFLEYREPYTARVDEPGEILALPPDALAALSAEAPELAHRLQRLAIQMIGSKLEKTSQTLAEP